MIRRFLPGTVIACLSVISLSANAVIINVSYTGTVDGYNTDFGFGTEIIFEGSYDTDDAAGDTVIFQSSSLSIGGTTQAGVNASAVDVSPPDARAEFFIQWDAPPPNPDLSIVFDASTVFPDLTGATMSDIVVVTINHDGAPPDPVLTTAFSVTAIPVPAAAWLFGSGLLGLVGVARQKKSMSLLKQHQKSSDSHLR